MPPGAWLRLGGRVEGFPDISTRMIVILRSFCLNAASIVGIEGGPWRRVRRIRASIPGPAMLPASLINRCRIMIMAALPLTYGA